MWREFNDKAKLPSVLEPFRERLTATVKPCAKVQTRLCKDATIWQSKFLGRPYWPKFDSFPKTSQGDYLYLLAQINFSDVPTLTGFPTKGILQFYLFNTDMYGLDFENPTCQDGFRVVYHAEPEMDESKLLEDFSFMASPWQEDDEWMPFIVSSKHLDKSDCCLALAFQRGEMLMSPQDYLHEATVGCDFFALVGAEGNALTKSQCQRELESYYQTFTGHHLGGYPAFAQTDPRSRMEQREEPYILLLQIDSDYNRGIEIMWGDSGVCNFFIKQSALERLDFSDVLYNWDCC